MTGFEAFTDTIRQAVELVSTDTGQDLAFLVQVQGVHYQQNLQGGAFERVDKMPAKPYIVLNWLRGGWNNRGSNAQVEFQLDYWRAHDLTQADSMQKWGESTDYLYRIWYKLQQSAGRGGFGWNSVLVEDLGFRHHDSAAVGIRTSVVFEFNAPNFWANCCK